MLQDPNFSADYVYTGLISPTKQVNDAYWMPRNISVYFIYLYLENKLFFIFLNSTIVH